MPPVRRHSAPVPLALRDTGIVEFSSDDAVMYDRLRDAMKGMENGERQGSGRQPVAIHYDDGKRLLMLLYRLQTELSPEEADRVRVALRYDQTNPLTVQLSNLFATVSGHAVAEYILHHYFTTYLQPIVQPGGKIIGYECLLRPLPEQPPFRPAELFAKARSIGQHTFLDQEARQDAIRISAAHLAPGIKRFVNFLPSSLYCADTCLRGTFEAIKETRTNPADVVFEVAESEPLNLPEMADIFAYYRERGVHMAVDDVGSGHATIEVLKRLKPDYVKLDRKWVSYCDQDQNKQRHIADVLEQAAQFHGIVLAEGVEREEEWHYLRRAGVPLLQGYLFGKAMPVPGGKSVAAIQS